MITVLIAGIFGFLISLTALPVFIKKMKSLKLGQLIREEGPAAHQTAGMLQLHCARRTPARFTSIAIPLPHINILIHTHSIAYHRENFRVFCTTEHFVRWF